MATHNVTIIFPIDAAVNHRVTAVNELAACQQVAKRYRANSKYTVGTKITACCGSTRLQFTVEQPVSP